MTGHDAQTGGEAPAPVSPARRPSPWVAVCLFLAVASYAYLLDGMRSEAIDSQAVQESARALLRGNVLPTKYPCGQVILVLPAVLVDWVCFPDEFDQAEKSLSLIHI